MTFGTSLLYASLYFSMVVLTSLIGIFLEDLVDDLGVIVISICCSTFLFIILGLTGVI